MQNASPYAGNEIFIDREFSWLAFNQRILDEALDNRNPLLERLKFLAIVASNLDEFFEVRVAALLQKIESSVTVDGIAGLNAQEKLDVILKMCQKMVRHQYRCWNESLLPEMGNHGIVLRSLSDLTPEEERYLQNYFRKEVFHLLTPIKVDPAHPFPWVLNKSLCLAVILKEEVGGRKREDLGVVTIPRSLPRVLPLPTREKGFHFIFIYEVVQRFIDQLFKGYQIGYCSTFRATRNSNLYLEEEEGSSLIDAVEAVVHNRRKGDVVRLEIDRNTPKKIVDALVKNFDMEPTLLFKVNGPVNLNRLMELYRQVPLRTLKYEPMLPAMPYHFHEIGDVFDAIGSRDILLHHPFDSFDPVVRFIQTAAKDPDVLAIKQTLYRTNEDSSIMYALLDAAELGKEVVVVVELKARFDEKSNISWARQLEEKGGTVLYGLVGLKTHAKLSLIVRREEGRLRRYAHAGTGNYNPETARLYTDMSFFSSHNDFTDDVSEVFNYLTSHSKKPDFRTLLVGPVNFLSETLKHIEREKRNALEGKPSGIAAKMNALFDKEVIEALYDASQAGVPIRLIIRGICALRPGVKGLSENIIVKSVVGRFLEHSRIYFFLNDNNPQVYLGSGDWMERNLRERVEVLWPLRDAAMVAQMHRILSTYWSDNSKVRIMKGDGAYFQPQLGEDEASFNAQEFLAKGVEELPPQVSLLFPGLTQIHKEAHEADAAQSFDAGAEEVGESEEEKPKVQIEKAT